MSEISGALPYRLRATPRPEVELLLELLSPGSTVLDVGAGLGNNAELILANGHYVVAIEPHADCLVSLRQLQVRYPEHLSMLASTVEQAQLIQDFDAVVCSMILHFLSSETAEQVLKSLRTHTRPGGFHAISWYRAGQGLSPDTYRALLRRNELRDRYKAEDWICLSYREKSQITLRGVRSSKDAIAWLRGRRGYKSAQIVARKP
jgi:2-polyprenyl-3-methyl-5-hydroxy-6-metoxy-1,4-benzoquinol methylase